MQTEVFKMELVAKIKAILKVFARNRRDMERQRNRVETGAVRMARVIVSGCDRS